MLRLPLIVVAVSLWPTCALAHYGTPFGDYNNNGVVDAADYVVWRDTLGSSTSFQADGNRTGSVTSADYDYWRARFGNVVPVDTLPNPSQPSFTNSPWLEQSGVTMPLADQVNYGEGITIGVVDSGIDSESPAFAGHLSPSGACYAYCNGQMPDNVEGTVTTDGTGHGTNVAGVAAGEEFNGHVGVAAKATVLAIKVYPTTGGDIPTADIVAHGVHMAAERGANVINVSSTPVHGLSTTNRANYYKAFSSDVNYAASQNAITVFAGGDEGTSIVGSAFIGSIGAGFNDAAIQRIIFVGGVDSGNNLAAGSNTPGTGKLRSSTGSQVSISDRWLVVNDSVIGLNGTPLAGTDYAAPQVAGAIALLQIKWPQVKADGTAATILLVTATDLGAPGTDAIFGHGLLNMQAAFQPLGGTGAVTLDGEYISIVPSSIDPDGTINVTQLDPRITTLTAYDSFGRDFPIRVMDSPLAVPESASWLLLVCALFWLNCIICRRIF